MPALLSAEKKKKDVYFVWNI